MGKFTLRVKKYALANGISNTRASNLLKKAKHKRNKRNLTRQKSRSATRVAAVKERDGNSCFYCKTEEDLTIDHIVPIADGGGAEIDNLRLVCRLCNNRKGRLSHKDFLVSEIRRKASREIKVGHKKIIVVTRRKV